MAVKPIPEGYHTFTPYYVVEGASDFIEFLKKAFGGEELYRFPLRQSATDTLNRQLRSGITDGKLAELVVQLREDDRLCVVKEEERSGEPQIICSLGLAPGNDPIM